MKLDMSSTISMAETCKIHLQNSLVLLLMVVCIIAQDEKHFIYNGFHGAKLHLDGLASILPNGLLQVTNGSFQGKGHAFHPQPIKLDKTRSFSTIFSFAIVTDMPDHCGHGLAFVISPSINFKQATPAEYLGIFNVSNNGLNSNHIFAVELDVLQNAAFHDIDGNHVGIDVNGLVSIDASPAAYYSNDEGTEKKTLQLSGGSPMKVWIDYNGEEMQLNVTIAPIKHPKPMRPLLSTRVNLSSVLLDSMYVGFTSGTGLVVTDHYVSGWSWSQIGRAQELDLSRLPPFPEIIKHNGNMKFLYIALAVFFLLLLEISLGVAFVVWKTKYRELKENWEEEFISHRFSFKDLYAATKGFSDSELLGFGGFGKVYRGIISSKNTEVAVKKISHDSKQGIREFVSEILTMRSLRHRNLVQLLGYCRRKGELLLVYEYMPNGSLDKFLFKANSSCLSWYQRYNIVKGVASALLYLHEEAEQVILHRDVKASNVLLDAEMNARLGDFGLARLYDHESDPQSTRVVGTLGYLAPELSITGKPSTSTDVYAYGVFLLEVACGRRPNSLQDFSTEDYVLVDWVYDFWKKGIILDTCDPKLQGNYEVEEMKLVLQLGLLCAYTKPEGRPSMRQVVQYLNGDGEVPDIPSDYNYQNYSFFGESGGISTSYPSLSSGLSNATLSSEISIIHQGR